MCVLALVLKLLKLKVDLFTLNLYFMFFLEDTKKHRAEDKIKKSKKKEKSKNKGKLQGKTRSKKYGVFLLSLACTDQ